MFFFLQEEGKNELKMHHDMSRATGMFFLLLFFFSILTNIWWLWMEMTTGEGKGLKTCHNISQALCMFFLFLIVTFYIYQVWMELTGAAGEEGENRARDMSCHRYIYIMFFFFFYTNRFLVIGYAVVPHHPMAHPTTFIWHDDGMEAVPRHPMRMHSAPHDDDVLPASLFFFSFHYYSIYLITLL